MKRIIIIRHAKSSWDHTSLMDHDRPLTPKGILAANKMGIFLTSKNYQNIVMISSTAVRASATANIIASGINYQKDIIYDKQFYTFNDDGSVFVNYAKSVQETIDTIIFIGHNETCYQFVSEKSNNSISKFPTCALASFLCDIKKWNEINTDKLEFELYQFPKELE